MSFMSSVVISFLEKELAAQAPEVSDYILKELSVLAQELVGYVEKKIAPQSQTGG